MFKKGEYIVTLKIIPGTACAKENFIFKQRVDSEGMQPCVDLDNNKSNGNASYSADKTRNLKNWRYANPQEAIEYERLGHPYDVTTLQPVNPEDTSYLIEIFAKNNIT